VVLTVTVLIRPHPSAFEQASCFLKSSMGNFVLHGENEEGRRHLLLEAAGQGIWRRKALAIVGQ
jgi:hypothetical protein